MELSAGQQPGPPFKDVPWKSQLLVSAGLHAALFWVVVAFWPNSDHVDTPERQVIDVELVSRARPLEAPPSNPPAEVQVIKESPKPPPARQKKHIQSTPAKRTKAEPVKTEFKPPPVVTSSPSETGPAEKPLERAAGDVVDRWTAEEIKAPGRAAPVEAKNDKAVAEGVVRKYQRQIKELIESKKRYPLTARKGRQQGKVRVVFQLDAYGNLIAADVASSSGYQLLDRAALKAVHAVGQFPSLPVELSVETRFQIDLDFRLK